MHRTITAVFFFCLTASAASSAVLQIDDNGAAGQWNHLDPVQTGTVGSTRVKVESTAAEWESNGFTDESASYTNTALYGSLAQPVGTIGDLYNQQIFTSTGSFTWTVTFLDPISDPIFYFGDLDNAGATLTAPSGYASYDGNSDFSKSGDVFTVLSGAWSNPVTVGAFIAIEYEMDFEADDFLMFSWEYSGAPGGENIGLGIATMPVTAPPTTPIPLPASGLLLAASLGVLSLRRRGTQG